MNRFQRSAHLVCYWEAGGGLVYDYATGVCARLSSLTWRILDACTHAVSVEDLCRGLDGLPADVVRQLVDGLLTAGFLTRAEGKSSEPPSPRWGGWDPAAGFFHSISRQCVYGDPHEHDVALQSKATHTPMPPSIKPASGQSVSLPRTSRRTPLGKTAADRRTWRQFGRRAITVRQLSDLLDVTCGITHWLDIPGLDRVPLTSSPSAGGRHPLETYVLCINVRGLAPGFYRYAAERHALDRAGPAPANVEALFPSQPWFGGCAAALFFTAVFARTQWRYDFARAYRAVMIEAGHVCQTFLLAASERQLAPFCTMAIDENTVESALGIDGVSESVLYAAGVGSRPSALKTRVIMPSDVAPPKVMKNVVRRQAR